MDPGFGVLPLPGVVALDGLPTAGTVELTFGWFPAGLVDAGFGVLGVPPEARAAFVASEPLAERGVEEATGVPAPGQPPAGAGIILFGC